MYPLRPIALATALTVQMAVTATHAAPVTLSLTSPNKGNVFVQEDGELTLETTALPEGATGVVVLENEYGSEIQRLPISPDQPTMAIPLSEKGYYHITATVTDTQGHSTSTETTAAVIGPALPDELRMQSNLGLWNVHGDKDLVAAAGARFNRAMKAVFKYDEDFLRYADPSVPVESKPRKEGEPIFDDVGVISFGLPEWMLAPKENGRGHSYGNPTRAPKDWDQLSQLIKAFTRNSSWPEFPKYFEIYNEPEWQWEGTDEDFVRFLATIADAIKEVRPDVEVLGPGFSQPRLHTSNRIGLIKAEQLGLLDHLDGIAVHCYVDGSAPEGEFIDNIIQLKNFLQEVGHGDMPLHFTEFGWTSKAGTWQRPVDELTQAQYLVRSLTLLSALGVENATYFCYIFNGNGKLGEQGFSVAHLDHTPKPAYAAFSNLTRWLAGVEKERYWIHLTPTAHFVLFSKPDQYIGVLWDAAGESSFKIPGTPDRLADMTGRALAMPADGTLTLSPSPVFISWPKQSDEAVTVADTLELMRGNTATVDFSASAAGYIPTPLSIEGDKLTVPNSTPAGTYTFVSKNQYGWSLHPADVSAPIHLSEPQLTWPIDNAQPQLTVNVQSHAQETLEVRGAAKVKELRSFFADPVTLSPGASQNLTVDLGQLQLGKAYSGDFEVISQAGKQRDSLNQPFAFTLLTSAHTESAFPEWPSIASVDFSQWAPFGGPIDPQDCSATFQSAYSDEGLYLRVVVRDDAHMQTADAESMWSQDAIQLGFDIDIEKPWNANEFFGLKGHRVFEYGVGGLPGDEMTWRWISYMDELPARQSEPRIDVVIDRDEDEAVTTYELFFPWETLGASEAPKAGSAIGIALAVSDADPGKPKHRRALRLFNGIIDSKDPERFGRLWLR